MYSVKTSVFLKNMRNLFVLGLSVFFVQRVVLFIWSLSTVHVDLAQLIKAFLIGFLFDIAFIIYATTPFVLFFILFPKFKNKKTAESIYYTSINVLNFSFLFFVALMVTAEMFFWDEFTARFNFIAVDYLVYTTEVLKNIWESYPAFKFMLGLILIVLAVMWQINKRMRIDTEIRKASDKKIMAAGFVVLFILNYFVVIQDYSLLPKDVGYQEISKNGIYSLFYSYFENQINYDQFYMQLDKNKAMTDIKSSFSDGEIKSKTIESVKRDIIYPDQNSKPNVILVLMESMGARFLNSYGNKENLTPNLDLLASHGLFFNNIFATGTRTVRGIEAITLSVPPTPGQSIVRRPNNEKLVTINSYFAKEGYNVEFLYGGYAYFDNMKYFFENNDAKVLDINEIGTKDIHFSNAWGVCDEDLLSFSIKNADRSYEENKPFFQIVLTTSNHRPFTYPDNKIDIVSGSGRNGAVKYADYSIGKFIDEARNKPWFDNTIFVFVADHDAGVAGNTEVYKKDYLIPLIFFAPKMIKPETISKLGSQIDVGPTLMGLLSISHESFGFGYDLRKSNTRERAFISNYQKIGYMEKNFLTLLEPGKKFKQYKISESGYQDVDLEKDELDHTISFYQTASHLYKDNKLKNENEKLLLSHLPK